MNRAKGCGPETANHYVRAVRGFFRKPYGPGWALVGDAGHEVDPITGHGINDAFLDVELLVEAVNAGFSGRRPLTPDVRRVLLN